MDATGRDSAYLKLIHDVSQDLSVEEAKGLCFLSGLSSRDLVAAASRANCCCVNGYSSLDLLEEMQAKGFYGRADMAPLEDVLKEVGRVDLATKCQQLITAPPASSPRQVMEGDADARVFMVHGNTGVHLFSEPHPRHDSLEPHHTPSEPCRTSEPRPHHTPSEPCRTSSEPHHTPSEPCPCRTSSEPRPHHTSSEPRPHHAPSELPLGASVGGCGHGEGTRGRFFNLKQKLCHMAFKHHRPGLTGSHDLLIGSHDLGVDSFLLVENKDVIESSMPTHTPQAKVGEELTSSESFDSGLIGSHDLGVDSFLLVEKKDVIESSMPTHSPQAKVGEELTSSESFDSGLMRYNRDRSWTVPTSDAPDDASLSSTLSLPSYVVSSPAPKVGSPPTYTWRLRDRDFMDAMKKHANYSLEKCFRVSAGATENGRCTLKFALTLFPNGINWDQDKSATLKVEVYSPTLNCTVYFEVIVVEKGLNQQVLAWRRKICRLDVERAFLLTEFLAHDVLLTVSKFQIEFKVRLSYSFGKDWVLIGTETT